MKNCSTSSNQHMGSMIGRIQSGRGWWCAGVHRQTWVGVQARGDFRVLEGRAGRCPWCFELGLWLDKDQEACMLQGCVWCG